MRSDRLGSVVRDRYRIQLQCVLGTAETVLWTDEIGCFARECTSTINLPEVE